MFTYGPLSPSSAGIVVTRLITLLPYSSVDGEIQCTLEVVKLKVVRQVSKDARWTIHREEWDTETKIRGCMDYQALSYLWGPPGDNQAIQTNSFKHNVRRNLWEFLD